MTYVVITRDVDGSSRRTYKMRANAVRYFESMYGHSMQTALEEQVRENQFVPRAEDVRSARGVSDFGTVVIFREED